MSMKLGSHLLCLSPKIVKKMVGDLEAAEDNGPGLGETLDALLTTLRGLVEKDPSQWGVQLDWSDVIAQKERCKSMYLERADQAQSSADGLAREGHPQSASYDQARADRLRQRAAECDAQIQELKNG